MLSANYKTKKDLKTQIGHPLRYTETSIFGNEYKSNGTFCVVGPSPQVRKWYAQITMKDNRIEKIN